MKGDSTERGRMDPELRAAQLPVASSDVRICLAVA